VRSPAALGDPISDKQAEAAQLATQINSLGTKIDDLSQQYDATQQQVQQLSGQVSLVRSQVAADEAQVRTVQGRLRTEAVNAFTSGGSGSDSESITEDVLQGHMDAAGVRSGFMASVAIMGAEHRRPPSSREACARDQGG
jgi:septal ring factor EnvC (AmiA/AmiB activator)